MGHDGGQGHGRTPTALQQLAHLDRVRALAETDSETVQVQPVDSSWWRVIDAAADWGDPEMLLGFIERTVDGYGCTLMATLRRRQHTPSLTAARAYLEDRCGRTDEVPC